MYKQLRGNGWEGPQAAVPLGVFCRYLVRWKGYDDEDDKTWEPRRSFQEGKLFCQELLDYEKLHGLDPVPPPAVKKEKKEKPKPTAEPKKRPPGAVKAESAAAREDRSKRRKV